MWIYGRYHCENKDNTEVLIAGNGIKGPLLFENSHGDETTMEGEALQNTTLCFILWSYCFLLFSYGSNYYWLLREPLPLSKYEGSSRINDIPSKTNRWKVS